MKSDSKTTRFVLFTTGTIIAILLSSVWSRLVPESAAVARGASDANLRDCIACHGQPGIDNPDDAALECANPDSEGLHPRYTGECNDLLAFFEAVRLKRSFKKRAEKRPQNILLRGESLAREYNCFLCHGELGQGGFPNEGALKGYVPGYFGNDFAQLTGGGSAESVRAWISQGIDPALFDKPLEGHIAMFFVKRQDVAMPDFGTLTETQIRILTGYVIALNNFGEMDAKGIRAYSQLTQKQ